MFNNISQRPTSPPLPAHTHTHKQNSHSDLRPNNFFSIPLIYPVTLGNLILLIDSCKQYKNNHSSVFYAEMTTYGTRLYAVTIIGILLILLGRFFSYFRVKVLLKRHSKVQVLAKLY